MDEVANFIVRTLEPADGTWASGVHGALAEFLVGAGEAVSLEVTSQTVTARTPSGAIRFILSAQLRAFEIGRAGRSGVVVLALPRNVVPGAAVGLVSLGLDTSAITESDQHEMLYDLGLGKAAGQFCIRTARPDLMKALDAELGQSWPSLFAAMGGQIVEASPTRVIRSPIGWIEVFSPIPPPGGQSPDGPHTHLLPTQLARGGDLSVELGVPDFYLPCAIHYPAQ